MDRSSSILGVVPARGGSKGVPRKNICLVRGKPLIVYTLEAASLARCLTRLVVSTEDEEIAQVARLLGVEVLPRPYALAADDTPAIAPVLHAIDAFPEFDYVVLLQPTSPLRSADDIDMAIDTCLRLKAPACVSVCEARCSPHWMYWINDDGQMRPVLEQNAETYARRQDLSPAYALNGAVYVARTDWLRETRNFLTPETVPFVMDQDRSLDIDTEGDIRMCECLLERIGPETSASALML